MTAQAEWMKAKAPFKVKPKAGGKPVTVVGFSQNDPLGVGGGVFPDMPTCYFKSGAWLLVSDLMKHYELVMK